MKTLSSALLLSLSLVACAATANDDADEATGATTEALGARQNFSCSGSFCTCTGDDDCNGMFSGSACTDGPAICQINASDIPRCRCAAAMSGKGHPVKRPPAVYTTSPTLSMSAP